MNTYKVTVSGQDYSATVTVSALTLSAAEHIGSELVYMIKWLAELPEYQGTETVQVQLL